MGFFEPITREMLERSAVPPVGNPADREWADEYQGDPGESVPIWVRKPTLFADDRIKVNVDRVHLSALQLSVKLSFRTDESVELPRLSGIWPWTVVSESAVRLHDWEPHVLAGNPEDVCRFGVSTANGGRVATGTGFRGRVYVFGRGDVGSVTSPALRMVTNSSSDCHEGGEAVVSLWPPPLEESVDLYFQWPAMAIPEVVCHVQQRSINAARQRISDSSVDRTTTSTAITISTSITRHKAPFSSA